MAEIRRWLRVSNDQDVPVLYDIVAAFQPQHALLAHTRIAAVAHQVFPVHHLGANELLLEIAVDSARSLLRGAVDGDGPCAHFGFARGEKGHEAEQAVSGGDQAFES